MTHGTLRVMVVDDNPIVRSGLVSLLEAGGEVEIAAEAGDGRQAIELASTVGDLDLILLDVRMPEMDGVAAVEQLSKRCHVVMLTNTEDAHTVQEAIRNGASGYLVHGTFGVDELQRCIRSAAAGANPLSPPAAAAVMNALREPAAAPPSSSSTLTEQAMPPDDAMLSSREAEVMNLIAQGKANGEIAAELFLSEKTVKNHVNRIYAKLGVTSRGAAIARWTGTDQTSSRPGPGTQR
ncbi:MAG: response regulator [Actinophytocola sp.]|nr:response regulator [Actinophytocola sp.]